jgi:hypothetical protein
MRFKRLNPPGCGAELGRWGNAAPLPMKARTAPGCGKHQLPEILVFYEK